MALLLGGRAHVAVGGAVLGGVELGIGLAVELLLVVFDNGCGVDGSLADGAVEVVHLAVAQALDHAHEHPFVGCDFAALELALEGFLGELCVACLLFVQALAYLVAGLGGDGVVQPVALGLLAGVGEYFHLVARLQPGVDVDVLSVDQGAGAVAAHVGVDVEGEVQHGGSLAELEEVALGGEDEDLVAVEVNLELVHQLLAACGLVLKG